MLTVLQNKKSRKAELEYWLCAQFLQSAIELQPLQNDASFRQYYRCTINGSSYVVMDAPPDKENIYPFIKMTEIMSQAGILVPELTAYDLDQGFMVLSDFGDKWLLEQLQEVSLAQVPSWYYKAIDSLLQLQQTAIQAYSTYAIPLFDAKHIQLELSYFSEWFLTQVLQLSLEPAQIEILEKTFELLVQSAQEEPQVLIHRDYHSRNLMVLGDERLGVIDYQDAMIGPMSYDLASLLKDCYIVWPKEQREMCLRYFYEQRQVLEHVPYLVWDDFKKSVDWIGLQRHLKVLGIFSRLKIRDNKPHYIKDIPRIMDYVNEVLQTYPEFNDFYELWQSVIVPAFAESQSLREFTCVP